MVPDCSPGQDALFDTQHDYHFRPLLGHDLTSTWGQVYIDLWRSSRRCFELSRREKRNGAHPMGLSCLVKKLFWVQFSKHFIFDDLWWSQYSPDSKMFFVWVVDLSPNYPTPFAVCRSDAFFFFLDLTGGEKAPPPRTEPFRARSE